MKNKHNKSLILKLIIFLFIGSFSQNVLVYGETYLREFEHSILKGCTQKFFRVQHDVPLIKNFPEELLYNDPAITSVTTIYNRGSFWYLFNFDIGDGKFAKVGFFLSSASLFNQRHPPGFTRPADCQTVNIHTA